MSISTVPPRKEVERISHNIQCNKCQKNIDWTFPAYLVKDFSRKALAHITSTKWCPFCEAMIIVKAYYGTNEEQKSYITHTELLNPEKYRVPKEMPRGLTVKCKNKRPVKAAED